MSENNDKTKEEFVKQYLKEYFRSFIGAELEYWTDFYKAYETRKRIDIAEYETTYLEKDEIYGPGKMPKGVLSERCEQDRNFYIAASNIFTIKLGAENIKKILEKIFRENSERGAANNESPPDWISEKEYLTDKIRSLENELESYFGVTEDIMEGKKMNKELEEKLEETIRSNNQDKERIISLNNDLKIERERIKSLENDVIRLEKLEKKSLTSEVANSSKQKSKTKRHNRRKKSKNKKSSTQEIEKRKIAEIPVQTTSDDQFLDKHFAAQSRDLKFYDFPAYWKDETIYEMLKKVGYIERLEVKWNYKYRTVRARIRLTKEMDEKFVKGGSNIALTRNDRTYFFRMFDAKLDASAIKRRYEWQAYKKLDKEELDQKDEKIIKDYNAALGGHFAKVIKINKIKYILMYFNNENDLLKAIYRSTMEEDLGKGLKIKLQDELIGDEGTYKRRSGINRFKIPTQTRAKDKFVDARSDVLSTIPRTEEEHQEIDDLNNNFSGRLEQINNKDKKLAE
ncbi:unnamed protein product [Rhizophagus irregularis]|uniref:Uncharacterized protein n=1 Tax=Rhizophagus irregularis TaxID=588596 RepID=A0A2I1GXH6_9GLOM|nr:hypothetical protein RhiirA4_493611 [Rhizophagus irregularis]CAB4431328.1 unnamed protein product [Rhizophagus irregularis]